MAHNERHEELVSAAALGLPADAADLADLERILTGGCPECEELLADLRVASTALASAAPATVPPAELKSRIMSELGPSRTEAPLARPRPSPLPWRMLAAAAALLLFVIVLDDARLRRQREELRSRTADLAGRLDSAQTELAQRALRARVLESDDVQMLMLGGKDPQPQARGRVFWSPRARRGVLVAGNLASLPPDRQYQLWVFLDGKPVDAGVFDADARGTALFESKDFPKPNAQNFAVTVEPRGGVPAPTGPIVLVGSPQA
jgi:anti-sigma-K factor RskA